MTPDEALAAFTQAIRLVNAGYYDEARAVELLPRDRKLVERRIAEAVARNAHDTDKEKI